MENTDLKKLANDVERLVLASRFAANYFRIEAEAGERDTVEAKEQMKQARSLEYALKPFADWANQD